MVSVIRYSSEHRETWNRFLERSKNGLFLFHRSYMEYHSDRFKDSSFLILGKGGQAIALFPASVRGDVVTSHEGLTFGGFITGPEMKTPLMMDVFEEVLERLREEGISKIVYKAIPHIYHTMPAEEDLYALFRMNATLIRRDVSSTILMSDRPEFTKERRWSIRKSATNRVEVHKSSDFEAFMKIEEENLEKRHGVKPVHSSDEIRLLAGKFPDCIRLFSAEVAGEMIGGVIVYESKNVAHLQYLAASELGRRLCAVDSIVSHLVQKQYVGKRYFDFGISTEKGGRHLNSGLSEYKDGFGGRATVYDTYEVNLGVK